MVRSQPTAPELPTEPHSQGPVRIRQDCPGQVTSVPEANHAWHD
jgi:hypothetical protein